MTAKACKNMALSQFELSKVTLKNLNKFDLSPTGKLVLLALVDCYNPKKEEIYPKQKTIADDLGISDRSVTRAIKEITAAGLLLFERKYQNRYKLTSIFFEAVKLSPVSCQSVPLENANLSPTCHEQKKEHKKNNIFSFQLTEFQKKYADVFQKLSENELKKYKALQGYEKEDYLKAKRKEYAQAVASKELQLKLENDKKSTGSPLDFDKEQAREYLNNLPPFLNDSFFARELRKKYQL